MDKSEFADRLDRHTAPVAVDDGKPISLDGAAAIAATAHADGYREGIHDAFLVLSVLLASTVAAYAFFLRRDGL